MQVIPIEGPSQFGDLDGPKPGPLNSQKTLLEANLEKSKEETTEKTIQFKLLNAKKPEKPAPEHENILTCQMGDAH